jgi:hypothetical protein
MHLICLAGDVAGRFPRLDKNLDRISNLLFQKSQSVTGVRLLLKNDCRTLNQLLVSKNLWVDQ